MREQFGQEGPATKKLTPTIVECSTKRIDEDPMYRQELIIYRSTALCGLAEEGLGPICGPKFLRFLLHPRGGGVHIGLFATRGGVW